MQESYNFSTTGDIRITMDKLAIKERFLSTVENRGVLELFEHIPDVYFWIKDNEGRFMANNQLAVQRKVGCITEQDVIGKTDKDFFPPEMADAFLKDDHAIMESGQKQANIVELILNEDGSIHWTKTTKIPLFNSEKKCVGIAGFTYFINKAYTEELKGQKLGKAFEYIQNNFRNNIRIKDLGDLEGLSVSQFERKFKTYFNTTPLKFILALKIKSACKTLVSKDTSIDFIARHEGFYNAGAFINQFKKQMGMLPSDYRKRYFRGNTKASGVGD